MKRIISVLLIFSMLLSSFAFSACSDNEKTNTDENANESETINNASEEVIEMYDLTKLYQTGIDSQRWLSVPLSRLVINPYEFTSPIETTHAQYSDRANLPLNIGYLNPYASSGKGEWLEDLLAMYEYKSGESHTETIIETDLTNTEKWVYGNKSYTKLTADGKAMHLTVKNNSPEAWQYIARKISIDLDENPVLTLTVDSCEGSWALKICEDGKQDEVLTGDTSKTGTYSYNLAELLGRSGKFEGKIKLFSIGYEKTLSFSRFDLQLIGNGNAKTEFYEITWTPSALEFNGTFEDGFGVSGFDTFYDENTVLRTVIADADGSLLITGKLPGNGDFADNTITAVNDNGRYNFAITSDNTLNPVFYKDLNDLLGNVNPSDKAINCEYYVLKFENLKKGDIITLAVSLTSDAKSIAQTAENVKNAVLTGGDKAREKWEKYWGEILAKVPAPSNFSIDDVDNKGVTEEQVEQMYYISWIFTLQDTLPANPELDFPYPQLACGKPSMYADGEKQVAYTATWESLFGIQLLGYIMPDLAWDAFMGIISLIDDDGTLGGESLPSEEAHTAWLLYTLTGDKDKLATVYDGIERHLKWRIKNPHWIYYEHNDVNSADADFVVSALIDIEYMEKICEILGKSEEREFWEKKYNVLLNKYYMWNFNGGVIYQYCDKKTMTRSTGNLLWCLKGLLVDKLDEKHKGYLFNAFNNKFDTDATFAGFSNIKYPNIKDTIRGLEKIGKNDEALAFAECCARDVVRAGMLSECYTSDSTPVSNGVRPSMFGAAMMIDSVLMMNGFSFQTASATSFSKTGSVENVEILP